jgi:hypothetical protein
MDSGALSPSDDKIDRKFAQRNGEYLEERLPQTVNVLKKQDFSSIKRCEDCSQVAFFLKLRRMSDSYCDPELIGIREAKLSFPHAIGTNNQDMVRRFSSLSEMICKLPQSVDGLFLPEYVVKPAHFEATLPQLRGAMLRGNNWLPKFFCSRYGVLAKQDIAVSECRAQGAGQVNFENPTSGPNARLSLDQALVSASPRQMLLSSG